MNKHTFFAALVSTIGATLALVSTSAMAAQPGGGGSTDPCTTAIGFPAFVYWKPSGKMRQIYVANSDGKCSRLVTSITNGQGSIQFSVIGADNTKGRVVWVEASNGVSNVVGIDFTVATATNQISVGTKTTLYGPSCGGISLSKDAHTLYSTRCLNTGEFFIDKVTLDTPVTTISEAFHAPDNNNYIGTISVNGDGTLLYADYKPSAGVSSLYQLVWIPLDGSNTITNVIDFNNRSEEFTPAVDPWSSTNRVAYQKRTATSGGCPSLLTSDINGIPTAPAQAAYGMKPTWVNGMIVADGFAPSTRSGCNYTGTIMQTDPVSGAQTALVSGYDPDGK